MPICITLTWPPCHSRCHPAGPSIQQYNMRTGLSEGPHRPSTFTAGSCHPCKGPVRHLSSHKGRGLLKGAHQYAMEKKILPTTCHVTTYLMAHRCQLPNHCVQCVVHEKYPPLTANQKREKKSTQPQTGNQSKPTLNGRRVGQVTAGMPKILKFVLKNHGGFKSPHKCKVLPVYAQAVQLSFEGLAPSEPLWAQPW